MTLMTARRRTGQDIRRLQATWFINADRTIKDLKIEGVPDAQLAAYLNSADSRPSTYAFGISRAIITPSILRSLSSIASVTVPSTSMML